jgi:hypothetical protein
MKPENKQSLAFEEINAAVGIYDFRVTVETDKENLSALDNSPFIIAFKATISQGKKTLGIGRSNSILSPKNKYIKPATIYCFNAAIVDGFSKAVKILDNLPLKANESSIEKKEDIEEDLEKRDSKAYFANDDDLKYMSEKQKNYLTQLISKKCNGTKREDYLNQIKSPYFSSFAASVLIKTLLSSNNY